MELPMSRDQIEKDKSRFGGRMLEVFERDGYACIECRMTMDEHVEKYRRRLTINHIDGTGRKKTHRFGESENHPVINNRLDNLETLCLNCHGYKDGKRTPQNQHGKFGSQQLTMF